MRKNIFTPRVIFPSLLLLSAWCQRGHAATLTVGKAGTSCPNAQYTTIGAALTAAAQGDQIHICPALYPEQLTITRPVTLHGLSVNGINRVLLQPTSMVNLGGLPYQAVISVVGTSNVNIDGLAIDASKNSAPADCSVTVAGIHFYDSAGSVTNNTITGAQVPNAKNCPFFPGNGFGIEVDTASDQSGFFNPFKVLIQGNSVHEFNRHGIYVAGAGVVAQIDQNTISGVGPSSGYNQFGVTVATGALAQVTHNTISHGNCGSIDFVDCIDLRSEGILFRLAADGSVADSNLIANVQSGVFLNTVNNVRITNNMIRNVDAFDGINALAKVTKSTISGNTISHVFPISDFSSQEYAGCGINIYSEAGSGMNTISNNTVNDAYCGVAYLTSDQVSGGTYTNTLYATLNEELYPDVFPPAVEPPATGQPDAPRPAVVKRHRIVER